MPGDELMSRKALYKLYWKLQAAIAPGLTDSQQDYEDVLDRCAAGELRWLDVGCGHHLLPTWRFEEEKKLVGRANFLVGVDADALSLSKHRTIANRVQANIRRLPFADGAFNLVTANMVFEHLDDPDAQLGEIARVLAPGGRLIFHTPNKYGYATLMAKLIPEAFKGRLVYLLHRRKEEDVFPAFYRINSTSDISSIARRSGFGIEEIRQSNCVAQFIIVPPLAVLELLWLRFLMTGAGRTLRPNLIAILQKSA
jgi:ubiquinone/menaquinone biosynthesis C-methylase UbiE